MYTHQLYCQEKGLPNSSINAKYDEIHSRELSFNRFFYIKYQINSLFNF